MENIVNGTHMAFFLHRRCHHRRIKSFDILSGNKRLHITNIFNAKKYRNVKEKYKNGTNNNYSNKKTKQVKKKRFLGMNAYVTIYTQVEAIEYCHYI